MFVLKFLGLVYQVGQQKKINKHLTIFSTLAF